eukprot:gene7848-9662_t
MIKSIFRSAQTLVRPTYLARQTVGPLVFNNYYGSDARLSEKEISDRVVDIVSKYDKVQGLNVTPNSTFKELGLDSLDSADILVAVEEEFGIEIPDEDADRISSCLETISYIRKNPTAK